MDKRTEAEAVAEIAITNLEPRTLSIEDPDGVERRAFAVPDGPGKYRLEWPKRLGDEWRDAPERRKGTARLLDLESFIQHVNRFRDEDSVLFANSDRKSPSIMCVFDYNRKTSSGEPRWGQHRAHYAFPLSDHWVAWAGVDGKELEQADFAEFIETRLEDVINPASANQLACSYAESQGVQFANAARLLDMSRGLAIRVEENIVQAVNLQTGEAQLQFESTHKDTAGQPVKLPGAFLIEIPIFDCGATVQIAIRIRYRKSGTSLTFILKMYRPEIAFDEAIARACNQAKTGTGLELLFGTPEA